MLVEVILLIIGLLFLVKGADLLVNGSSDLANFLKIPAIYVGLTVVAFGTSLPELIVSVFAVILQT